MFTFNFKKIILFSLVLLASSPVYAMRRGTTIGTTLVPDQIQRTRVIGHIKDVVEARKSFTSLRNLRFQDDCNHVKNDIFHMNFNGRRGDLLSYIQKSTLSDENKAFLFKFFTSLYEENNHGFYTLIINADITKAIHRGYFAFAKEMIKRLHDMGETDNIPNKDLLLVHVICSMGNRQNETRVEQKVKDAIDLIKYLLDNKICPVNFGNDNEKGRISLLNLSRSLKGSPVHYNTKPNPKRIFISDAIEVLKILLEHSADLTAKNDTFNKTTIEWLLEDIAKGEANPYLPYGRANSKKNATGTYFGGLSGATLRDSRMHILETIFEKATQYKNNLNDALQNIQLQTRVKNHLNSNIDKFPFFALRYASNNAWNAVTIGALNTMLQNNEICNRLKNLCKEKKLTPLAMKLFRKKKVERAFFNDFELDSTKQATLDNLEHQYHY
ncbi:hypothetical protein ACFLYA_03035 [Candidatus Dependentiae bacterium]